MSTRIEIKKMVIGNTVRTPEGTFKVLQNGILNVVENVTLSFEVLKDGYAYYSA